MTFSAKCNGEEITSSDREAGAVLHVQIEKEDYLEIDRQYSEISKNLNASGTNHSFVK